MRLDDQPKSGALVVPGPGGAPPPRLRIGEARDQSPLVEGLIRPATSLVASRRGDDGWLNCDGAASGWLNLTELLAMAQALGGAEPLSWIRRGRQLSGIASPVIVYDNFGIIQQVGLSPPTYRPLGAWYLFGAGTCGAGARRHSYYMDHGGVGGWVNFVPGSNLHWCQGIDDSYYIAWSASLDTAPNAAAYVVASLQSAKYMGLGVDGGISAVNFSAASDVDTLDLGVPIDTDRHVFEMWRSSGATFFAIDGVLRGSLPTPADGAPASLFFTAQGDATPQRMTLDWYLGVLSP